MNFKQVEIFVNVMRYGNFSTASEHLDMPPDHIRANMDALEKETGTKLYHDQSGYIEMTVAGQRFFREAFSIVRSMEQALRAIEECAPPDLIRAAARRLPGLTYLPGLIAAYRTGHPDIRFQLDILDDGQIINGIFEGRYDVGVACLQPAADTHMLQTRRVWTDRLVLTAPDTPAFQSLPPVLSLSALGKLPLILKQPTGDGTGTSQPSEAASLTAPPAPGKPPILDLSQNPVSLTGNDDEAILQMVARGLGAALLPMSLARQAPGIRICEIEDADSLPGFRTDYYVIYPRAEYYLPHLAEFLDLLPPLEQ
jgi:DNA-binding transcriptional LysR family regulator